MSHRIQLEDQCLEHLSHAHTTTNKLKRRQPRDMLLGSLVIINIVFLSQSYVNAWTDSISLNAFGADAYPWAKTVECKNRTKFAQYMNDRLFEVDNSQEIYLHHSSVSIGRGQNCRNTAEQGCFPFDETAFQLDVFRECIFEVIDGIDDEMVVNKIVSVASFASSTTQWLESVAKSS